MAALNRHHWEMCVIEREAFGFGSDGGKKIISLTKGQNAGGKPEERRMQNAAAHTMQMCGRGPEDERRGGGDSDARLKYFKVYHSLYFIILPPFSSPACVCCFLFVVFVLCAKSGKFHFRQQVTVS